MSQQLPQSKPLDINKACDFYELPDEVQVCCKFQCKRMMEQGVDENTENFHETLLIAVWQELMLKYKYTNNAVLAEMMCDQFIDEIIAAYRADALVNLTDYEYEPAEITLADLEA